MDRRDGLFVGFVSQASWTDRHTNWFSLLFLERRTPLHRCRNIFRANDSWLRAARGLQLGLKILCWVGRLIGPVFTGPSFQQNTPRPMEDDITRLLYPVPKGVDFENSLELFGRSDECARLKQTSSPHFLYCKFFTVKAPHSRTDPWKRYVRSPSFVLCQTRHIALKVY